VWPGGQPFGPRSAVIFDSSPSISAEHRFASRGCATRVDSLAWLPRNAARGGSRRQAAHFILCGAALHCRWAAKDAPMSILSGALKQLLLPPSCLILLVLAGLLLIHRLREIGWWIALVSALLLYLLATPLGSGSLARLLERAPPLAASALPSAQAIVVPGVDSDYDVESGGLTVGPLTLARLRYGAMLQRRTGLPILVSGGSLSPADISLAEQMRQTLESDYGVTLCWVEPRSRDTWENAVDSAALLRDKHVERIILVAQARDMARAAASFRKNGLHVLAAPIAFDNHRVEGWHMLVPSAQSLLASYYALYEIAGLILYRYR